jgi:hypothetical protein
MENLARYHNLKILPVTLSYSLGEEFYFTSVFEAIYADMDKKYPGDYPAQFKGGIKEFEARQS